MQDEEIRDDSAEAAAESPEVAAAAEPATPSMVDGRDHAVDPNSVFVDRLVSVIVLLSVGAPSFIGVTIGWALGGIPTWLYLTLVGVWLAVMGFGGLIGYKFPALHHKYLRYRVEETGVRIKRGVLWRKIINIPNSRVQHTDVAQGPLQRRYGIATLTVHTAGTEGASIELAGLRHDVALRLRDHLLPTGDNHAV